MADDDIDPPDPAPLPAYDREWRHPAEHVDAERTRHLSTAPPVGRRLLMLTAVVSLLASGSLLFVVIPKGISEYTSGNSDAGRPTSVTVGLKGGAELPIVVRARSSRGESTAVCLGNGRFLVPVSLLDDDGVVQIDSGGTRVVAPVTTRYDSIGVAVVRTTSAVPDTEAIDSASIVDPEKAADFDGHSIIDAWERIPMVPEKSIKTTDSSGDVPIGTSGSVHGLGVVMDAMNHAVGIVVRRDHSSWILSRSSVEMLLSAKR